MAVERFDLGRGGSQGILQVGCDPCEGGTPRILRHFDLVRHLSVERLSEETHAFITVAADAVDDPINHLPCRQILAEYAARSGPCPLGKFRFLKPAMSG